MPYNICTIKRNSNSKLDHEFSILYMDWGDISFMELWTTKVNQGQRAYQSVFVPTNCKSSCLKAKGGGTAIIGANLK